MSNWKVGFGVEVNAEIDTGVMSNILPMKY